MAEVQKLQGDDFCHAIPGNNRFSPVAKAGGFSLHAGVSVQAHERKKLEQLRRYVARPAVSGAWP